MPFLPARPVHQYIRQKRLGIKHSRSLRIHVSPSLFILLIESLPLVCDISVPMICPAGAGHVYVHS